MDDTSAPDSLRSLMPSGKLILKGFHTRGSNGYCCPTTLSISSAGRSPITSETLQRIHFAEVEALIRKFYCMFKIFPAAGGRKAEDVCLQENTPSTQIPPCRTIFPSLDSSLATYAEFALGSLKSSNLFVRVFCVAQGNDSNIYHPAGVYAPNCTASLLLDCHPCSCFLCVQSMWLVWAICDTELTMFRRKLTISGVESLKDVNEKFFYNIQQLKVMLVNGHFKVQPSKFTEVTMSV